MQLRPNPIGPKSLYFGPGLSQLSTANLANIQTYYGADPSTIKPYAYTATVSAQYDTRNFMLDDSGSSLVAGRRVAFGLFLTPENNKGSMLFQVSGSASFRTSASGSLGLRGAFFFGRRNSSDTVVSSTSSANNPLTSYILLPLDSISTMYSSAPACDLQHSTQTEIYAENSAKSGYVYCFGYYIENYNNADLLTYGGVSLSIRKFTDDLGIYAPSRS